MPLIPRPEIDEVVRRGKVGKTARAGMLQLSEHINNMKITKKETIKHNISRAALTVILAIVPAVASAQYQTVQSNPCTTKQSLCTLVYEAIGYFNEAIYLIIALAVLTFIWNVYKYFIVSDPANRGEASKYVMFSVIGLFVILSFWGLVNILSNTLNLSTTPGAINVQALTGSSNTTNSPFSASNPNALQPGQNR